VHALAPDVPAELEAICDKAMARDVARRNPDMQALGDDLRACLEQRVVRAHESGALVELKKRVRRNRALAAALAVAALTTIVGSPRASS
jgi:serine/threonine-protein kinase